MNWSSTHMAPQQRRRRGLSASPLELYTPACRHFWSSGSLYCTWASVLGTSRSQLGHRISGRQSTTTTTTSKRNIFYFYFFYISDSKQLQRERDLHALPLYSNILRVCISVSQLLETQDPHFLPHNKATTQIYPTKLKPLSPLPVRSGTVRSGTVRL